MFNLLHSTASKDNSMDIKPISVKRQPLSKFIYR